MATRMIKQWFFSEKDKEQIKSYSKDISILFKIRGYNPSCDQFEDYFSLEDFDFIPCIREALDYTEEDLEDITVCLDHSYEPSTKVSLKVLKKDAEEQGETVKERLVGIFYDLSTKTTDDLIEFILTCDDEVKQRFVDYLVG